MMKRYVEAELMEEPRLNLSVPLSNLLHEVSRECQRTMGLIAELLEGNLTAEEMDKKLSRLSTSALYLHSHTCGMQDFIHDEIEEVYAKKHKAEKGKR